MIFYFIPWATDKHIGRHYNACMELLPNDDDFACFVDADAVFCTHYFGSQIEAVVAKHPDCGLFTCVTNRVYAAWQIPRGVDRTSNDMEYHRRVGENMRTKYYDECEDVTDLQNKGVYPWLSGVLILLRKSTWKKIGGFYKDGFFEVDNYLHRDVAQHGERIMLMKGVYVYHWWRNNGSYDHSVWPEQSQLTGGKSFHDKVKP